jgi:ribosome recycling factor
MLDDLYKETRARMEKTLDSVKRDFGTVRTGRASLHILDAVRVEYFGSQMQINQMANVAVPDARLIEIKPYDKSALQEIEKAILKANLGLTPMNDGKVVRISFPPLTEERRKELAKVVRKMSEDGKVSVRNLRREANESVQEFEKEKLISEDDAKAGQAQVQKLTDEAIARIEELLAAKDKEIMEI